MSSILVTGANGQIGSELVERLRGRDDTTRVIRLDLQPPPTPNGESPAAPVETADVRDRGALEAVLRAHDVDVVYHLASLLSAAGEQQPDRTWDVNMTGLKNVLDLARQHDLRVFWPSSIAVFGPSTPRDQTPQQTVLDPDTIYGVTKRSGELLCRYYHHRYGLDVRSLRFPGLVSYQTAPGGGTTDYAVEMYVRAARNEAYDCFLAPDTHLPLMYMPDALRAILALMDADGDALSVRDSYNISAFSVSPREVAASIRRQGPDFSCSYAPDERQQIAEGWPSSVDDRAARADWDWTPAYDLDAMTADMLEHLSTGEQERLGESARGSVGE
jgi:nucleoside-diphosphate-sugar epimerase